MKTLVETPTNLHIFFDLLQWFPEKYHICTRKHNENRTHEKLREKTFNDFVNIKYRRQRQQKKRLLFVFQTLAVIPLSECAAI